MKRETGEGRAGLGSRRPLFCVGLLSCLLGVGFGIADRALAQGGPAAAATATMTAPYVVGRGWACAIAVVLVVVVLLLTLLVKGKDNLNFFQSPDGSVSVSKVQVWMWTMTLIFGYAYLFLWRGPPEKFPDSLWQLMGISTVSSGTARYIAMMSGKDKPPTAEVRERIAKQNWLVSMLSEDGAPSMMRLQMFGWTLVTIFLFLIYLNKNQALWDVPSTLVILMGISHVGYLGDKGAGASKPKA